MSNEQFFQQLEQVRKSGKTNMFDRHGVAQAASEMEFYDLAVLVMDTTTFAKLTSEFREWKENNLGERDE